MRSLQRFKQQTFLALAFFTFVVPVVHAAGLGNSLANALELVFGPQGLFGVLQNQYVAWGVTVIGLFLILYNVFVSALKRVPLFKGEGGVAASSSGKAVAIALSLISSVGIFYGTGADGLVFVRILQWMGRYGVVVFMILIFYVTYGFLKSLHPSIKMKHVAIAVALFLAGFFGVSLLQHMKLGNSSGLHSLASLTMIAGIVYFPIAVVRKPSAKQLVKEEQQMGNDLQKVDSLVSHAAQQLPQEEKQEQAIKQELQQEAQQEQQEHIDEMKIGQLLRALLAAVQQPRNYNPNQLFQMYQTLLRYFQQSEQLMQQMVQEDKKAQQQQWQMIKQQQQQLKALQKPLYDFVQRYDELDTVLKEVNLKEYGLTKELVDKHLKKWEVLEEKIARQEETIEKQMKNIEEHLQKMLQLRQQQKQLLMKREPTPEKEKKVLQEALHLQSKILGHHQELAHIFSSLSIDLQQIFLEFQLLVQTAKKIHEDIQNAMQGLPETEQVTLQERLMNQLK